MWPQISGILDFGFWGFWILDLGDFGFWILDSGDFGFWILGILDLGFWIWGILDFGFWGFWILDFGPLCSKSLCEAPNAPNLGDFGFWILGILGILDFGFWGFWILDFGVWGFWILDFGFCDNFWMLHKKRRLCTPNRVGGFTPPVTSSAAFLLHVASDLISRSALQIFGNLPPSRKGHSMIVRVPSQSKWPASGVEHFLHRCWFALEARNPHTNDTQVVLFGGNEQACDASVEFEETTCLREFHDVIAMFLCDSFELPWLAKFDTHLTHLALLHWEPRSEIWQGPTTEWSLDFECQASWPMPQRFDGKHTQLEQLQSSLWELANWMEMVHPKLTVQSWNYLATLNFQVQRRLCQGVERSWTQIVWHPKHGAEVT